MNEWVEMKLGEIGYFKSSGVDKVIKPEEKIVRLVNYMDVYNSVKIDNSFYLSETSATQHEIDSFGLKKGDVLFTPTSETPDDIGHSSVVIEDLQNAVYSYHLTRFREFSEKLLDDEFKAYIFNHYFVLHQFEKKAAGSTRFTLTRGSFESTIVRFTKDLKIQRKIACILSTADAVIEKTQAAIAKYKAIKQGMLHDLFTRGIDPATNKLRPTYEDAPELYKQSKLGWIPKEWDEKKLDNYFGLLRSGLSRLLSEQDIGLPVLISGNIQENKIDFSALRYWYENDPQGADTSAYILQNGDILLCFINSIDQIGKVAIYEGYFRPCIYTTNLFRIKASTIVKSKFLYYLLSSEIVQNEIKAIVKPAVNQASFTTKDFCKIPVPIISDREQNLITKNIEQIDNKIQTEQTYLHKLQQIKSGLMADLLSGKKTVKIEEEVAN